MNQFSAVRIMQQVRRLHEAEGPWLIGNPSGETQYNGSNWDNVNEALKIVLRLAQDALVAQEEEDQPMPSDLVSIRGLNKADVLAALYNASQPLGMGILHFDPKPMTREEAQQELVAGCPHPKGGVYFDYLKGRVMKVHIGGDFLDPFLYDRDNGPGAAARAIEPLRQKRG